MKETLELRVNYEFSNILFKTEEGKNVGTSIKIVQLSKDDSRYLQIPLISTQIQQKYNKAFFFGWEIKRKYSKKEIENSNLLHMKIKVAFEPTGEECGTLYDEESSCEICGDNRKQLSPLKLKLRSIPKKDIARTIAGELVVSLRFANACNLRKMRGIKLEPIYSEKGNINFFQLQAASQIELSQNTIAGINPFNLSTENDGEIYKCPYGHTIGLNLLSEPFVLKNDLIEECDFLASKQKIGVKRGLLRPESIYFCSQAFRKMVLEEKLTGFDFERANIE